MVLLFSNERVIRHGEGYYARIINFTDFLVMLSRQSDSYRLALSCDDRRNDELDTSRLTPVVNLQEGFLELPFLKSRYQSFLFSFYLAWLIRRDLKRNARAGDPLAVLSPGLNSITFMLSFLLPRRTRWYLCLRGDTRQVVDEIYRHSWLRRLMTGVIDLFQWRIHALMRSGRGRALVYGQNLQSKFYSAFPERTHVVSPLLSDVWINTPAVERNPDLGNRRPRVIFAGRLSAEKNVAALIEACAAADKGPHSFDLTIAGDGVLESELRAQAAALDIEARIEFAGRVANGPELIALYDAHDIFCLPSLVEGTPRAVAEAVARGIPAVASDAGSTRHMFAVGIVEILEQTGASDIEAALSRVIDDFPARLDRASRARADAARHSLQHNVERIHDMVRQELESDVS